MSDSQTSWVGLALLGAAFDVYDCMSLCGAGAGMRLCFSSRATQCSTGMPVAQWSVQRPLLPLSKHARLRVLLVLTDEPGPFNLRTTWSYTPVTSDGKNVQIYNNGHTIQASPEQSRCAV